MLERAGGRVLLVALAAFVFATPPARAIIDGAPSGLGAHIVKVLSSGGHCSGVAIGAAAVVTAGHCARGAVVVANGQRVAVASVTRSASIDGRRVSVAGDAAILILRQPLPPGISPLPIGDGSADGALLIAGFGTADERHRAATGTLRQASVVPAGRNLLVDPNRSGRISASACYGDSGGAVLSGGMLVGIITRASYPRARIACGWYTQYAPVSASGPAIASTAPPSSSVYAVAEPAPSAEPARESRRSRFGRRAPPREEYVRYDPAAPERQLVPFTLAADQAAPVKRKKVRHKKKKRKKYRLSRRR